jgi:soluble lytic murein transglycosylase-like protein
VARRRYRRRRGNPSRRTLGLGIAAVLALLTFGTAAVAVARTHSNPPIERAKLQALADTWAPRFGVAPQTMMAIGKIESGWRPDTVNYSIRSIPLGGAWGPWQMTQKTAGDMARVVSKKYPAIAARWRGDGRKLTTDLELAAALSAAFLGQLAAQFDHDFTLTVAAYHQGAGKIRQMIRDKQAIPSQLPPKGKEYVTLALAARKAIG